MSRQSYPPAEYAARMLFFIVCIAITTFGAAAFVLANTGTDSFGVLMQGVAHITGLSNGAAHISINLLYLILILLIDRKYVRIGTFVALFCTGIFIDGSTFLLRPIILPGYPYPVRLVIMLLSCVLLGFGLAGIINAGVGTGANDIVAVLISDKSHIQFRWVRIAVDVTTVAVGWLLGGVVGVGTIACALLIGPAGQFFMPPTAKILAHILRRLPVQTTIDQ